MKRILVKMIAVIVVFVCCFSFLTVFSSETVFAGCPSGQVETSILGGSTGCVDVGTKGEGIYGILGTVIKVLTYLIGVLGTVGLVISGIQYMTAGGNESQVIKAKNRIFNIVIGLVAYGLMATFLNFIIPGGVF